MSRMNLSTRSVPRDDGSAQSIGVREQRRLSAAIAGGEQRVFGPPGYGETRRPRAPLRPVIRAHPQRIGAIAALIGGLSELRSGGVEVVAGRLSYAIDEKVPAAAPEVPEIILRDRFAIRVARAEQRRRGTTLPPSTTLFRSAIAGGEQRVFGPPGYGETRRPRAPLRPVIRAHAQRVDAVAALIGGLRELL